MMNALHDWRYVTPGDLASFGGAQARRRAISEKGWIGQTWLANYSITNTVPLLPPEQVARAKLPESYQVPHANFVHGGITPAWAARGTAHINAVGRSLLLKAYKNQDGTYLPPGTTPEERSLYSEDGPLWYRGYATDSERLVCRHAEEAARLLGAKHLVMGQCVAGCVAGSRTADASPSARLTSRASSCAATRACSSSTRASRA